MMTRGFAICAGLLVTAIYLNSTPSRALTMKECSEKYKAAKDAGNTQKWNDFRKAECGSAAAATPAAAPAAPAPSTEPAAEAKPEKKARKKAAKTETPEAAPAAPAATGDAVFPSRIAEKYAKESPGLARRHTCLDQYKANGESEANNRNGGLKWTVKGGGYYHECNNRLKAART